LLQKTLHKLQNDLFDFFIFEESVMFFVIEKNGDGKHLSNHEK